MTEESIRYAYRICPCFSHDIEGIQTWLEDLAAEGLLLEADGIFLGLYTFQKTAPKKVRYRLVPVKQKKGFFSDTADGPEEEEQAFSAQCGWEYLVRCGSFYIYRATDSGARPLHTDPAVHAMAIQAVKKRQWHTVISELLWLLIWFGLGRSRGPSLFITAALTGPMHLLCTFGLIAWVAGSMLVFFLRLTRYQKRLRDGDALERRVDWKRAAPRVLCAKLVPWILALGLLITWGISLKRSSEPLNLDQWERDVPFACAAELFPGLQPDRSASMGDYNTVLAYSTSLADNYEWNELANVTTQDGSYHCILRIKCHVTGSEFFARGIADNYYHYEAGRYHGKRFQDLQAPDTGLDSVRVFSSYGVLHVLIQHENTVIDAVISITDGQQNNLWHLWLEATAQKLLPE